MQQRSIDGQWVLPQRTVRLVMVCLLVLSGVHLRGADQITTVFGEIT